VDPDWDGRGREGMDHLDFSQMALENEYNMRPHYWGRNTEVVSDERIMEGQV